MAAGTDPDRGTLPCRDLGTYSPAGATGPPNRPCHRAQPCPGGESEISAAPVAWGHVGGVSYLLGDLEGAVPAALVAEQQVLGERTAAAW